MPIEKPVDGAYRRTIPARRLLAVLALLAALAPAVGGCGGEDLAPTAAVAEAADATVATRGMRIAMRQTLTLPGAGRMTTTGSGEMDPRGQRSHLTLKVGTGPDVVVGAFDKSDLTTEIITDRFTVYTHSAQLGQLLGAGRRWVKIDAAELSRAAGIDVSSLTQSGQDPTQALRQLRAVSGDIETIGQELVRGVSTTHYRATVDLRRYPDLVPAGERAAARASIEQLIHVAGASSMPVDVWVGKDDLVRRVRQKLSLRAPGGPSAIEQSFELYDFGTTVDIALPAPREVTDVTNLAAAGGRATVGP